MNSPEPIRISWKEWQSSRAAKREALRSAGVEASSRRKTSYSTSDRLLRKAFGGARTPSFTSSDRKVER